MSKMGFCAHTGKYLWVRISCTNIVYCPDFVYIYRKFISGTSRTFFAPSPYQGCTILAPCLPHPCAILAKSSLTLLFRIPLYMRQIRRFALHRTRSIWCCCPCLEAKKEERTRSEGKAEKVRSRATNRFAKPFFSNNSFLQFFQCLIQVGFNVFDIFDTER